MSDPTRSTEWQTQAACRDEDPELWFPTGTTGPALAQIQQAKAICYRCPVERECLEYALATRQGHGVWGGMTDEERSAILRARAERDWRQRLTSERYPDGVPEHELPERAA